MEDWDKGKRRRDGLGRFTFKRNTEADLALRAIEPGVLDEDDLLNVQAQFGVSEEQVRRDHAISHALAAISSLDHDTVLFFGGTALSRTHLSGLRLSEDIDLIALGTRSAIAEGMQKVLEKQLRRTLGAPSFTPPLAETRQPDPSVMQVGSSNIQIQLLSSDGYPHWPTEVVELEQRYRDAPPARVRVLTAAAFVVSKLASWNDRGAPRDLYDLWAMAENGMIDGEAADLFARIGPFTRISGLSFTSLPSAGQWEAALGHQCLIQVTPAEAVVVVREALAGLG
jgi:predicted nucleotidyltransferase component of viral defense system